MTFAEETQLQMQVALARSADLERRLTLLTAASGRLIATLDQKQLTQAIADLGIELVHADAIAVWRLNDGAWSIDAHRGLSEEFLRESTAQAARGVQYDDPLVYPDVFASPELERRHDLYRREGIASLLVAPLRIGSEASGSVVFYSRTRGHFTDVDTRTSGALANVAASALYNLTLHDSRRASEAQANFLAEAGSLLASTLDVESTLARIASLAVPRLGDWCSVHLLRGEGAIDQLAIAHVNPEKVRWAEELRRKYPPDPESGSGVPGVIRTGMSQLHERITDDMLVAGATDPQHLEILRALELRSVLIVPLLRSDRAFGAISLATTSESGRRLGHGELALAEALAARAALALENARLYREAREANELKDQFLATLSHELRTPLNALLGWSRMLTDGILDDPARLRALQAIQRNAQAQAQLVGDILELSRIVSGKVDLTLEPVEVGSLVGDIVESLQPTFQSKSLSVERNFEPSLLLTADRGRLQQVVLNLLTNAAKFTPDGGSISITGRAGDQQIEITFRDTGAGITAEFLPHVFERFRQGEPSTSRTYGGLGIGLSVCRHLVELHRGTITAHSEGLGKGSMFVIRLPVEP